MKLSSQRKGHLNLGSHSDSVRVTGLRGDMTATDGMSSRPSPLSPSRAPGERCPTLTEFPRGEVSLLDPPPEFKEEVSF